MTRKHWSSYPEDSSPATADATYYAAGRLPERLTSFAAIFATALAGLCIAYNVYAARVARTQPVPPLLRVAWDVLVYLIPASLLYAIDHWLHPPFLPIPMLLEPRARTHSAKSDLLAKILGLDVYGPGVAGRAGTSFAGSGRSAASRIAAGVGSGLARKFNGDVPPGLGNWDNSCYQNSILQGLASLRPLPAYLNGPYGDGGSTAGGHANSAAAETLRNLIADLNDENNYGKTLWTPSLLKSMSTYTQQDAQEYLTKLLDDIDREIAKAVKAGLKVQGLEADHLRDDAGSQHSDDSGYQSLSSSSKLGLEVKVPKNPLEGLIAQRVACMSCHQSDGLSMIPFNCLTLNLDTGMSEFNVYERLDAYTKVEKIEGVFCGKCTLLKLQRLLEIVGERERKEGRRDDKIAARLELVRTALEEDDFDEKTITGTCNVPQRSRVSSTKTKQALIARPPPSLILHINRSVFDERTGRLFKNSSLVRFPLILDLGPWCLGSAGEEATTTSKAADGPDGPPAGSVDEEQWLLDPTMSMVAGLHRPSKISGPLYELRAVVTHIGRHENGHYVCYRKQQRRRKTPETRDEKTSEVPSRGANGEQSATGDTEPSASGTEPQQDPLDGEEKEGRDYDWWRLSDETVYKVDEETVLAQGGVFMLFYDCIDSSIIPAVPEEESFEDAVADLRSNTSAETAPSTQAVTPTMGASQPTSTLHVPSLVLTGSVESDVHQKSQETTALPDDFIDSMHRTVSSGAEGNDVLMLAGSIPLPDDGDWDLE